MTLNIDKNKLVIFAIIFLSVGIIIYMICQNNSEDYNFIESEFNEEIIVNGEPTNTVENLIVQEQKAEEITIHITGEVIVPGIVNLIQGENRLINAIEKAGGTTAKADLNKVNLAYVLEDAQKVYIPSINDKQEDIEYVIDGNGSNSSSRNGEGGKDVNINKATQSELEDLPGIGPSTALKIIQYREENGNFEKIEDIQNVKGIGESKFNDLKDSIKVK